MDKSNPIYFIPFIIYNLLNCLTHKNFFILRRLEHHIKLYGLKCSYIEIVFEEQRI